MLKWGLETCNYIKLGLTSTVHSLQEKKTGADGGGLIRVDILPSTILDLARYPADAFSAVLNMKKQDPVTTIQTERQRETSYSLCSDDHVVTPSG